jgi:hypothetical protein
VAGVIFVGHDQGHDDGNGNDHHDGHVHAQQSPFRLGASIRLGKVLSLPFSTSWPTLPNFTFAQYARSTRAAS